jgi:hypothetical protein
MAIIKCKECKKEISSSAKECPHCGFRKYQMGCLTKLIIIVIGITLACYFLIKESGVVFFDYELYKLLYK